MKKQFLALTLIAAFIPASLQAQSSEPYEDTSKLVRDVFINNNVKAVENSGPFSSDFGLLSDEKYFPVMKQYGKMLDQYSDTFLNLPMGDKTLKGAFILDLKEMSKQDAAQACYDKVNVEEAGDNKINLKAALNSSSDEHFLGMVSRMSTEDKGNHYCAAFFVLTPPLLSAEDWDTLNGYAGERTERSEAYKAYLAEIDPNFTDEESAKKVINFIKSFEVEVKANKIENLRNDNFARPALKEITSKIATKFPDTLSWFEGDASERPILSAEDWSKLDWLTDNTRPQKLYQEYLGSIDKNFTDSESAKKIIRFLRTLEIEIKGNSLDNIKSNKYRTSYSEEITRKIINKFPDALAWYEQEELDLGSRVAEETLSQESAEASMTNTDTPYSVTLNVVGDNKIKVIAIVRAETGLGLKESKDLVDKVPLLIKSGLTIDEAEKLVGKLVDVGAEAEMKEVTSEKESQTQTEPDTMKEESVTQDRNAEMVEKENAAMTEQAEANKNKETVIVEAKTVNQTQTGVTVVDNSDALFEMLAGREFLAIKNPSKRYDMNLISPKLMKILENHPDDITRIPETATISESLNYESQWSEFKLDGPYDFNAVITRAKGNISFNTAVDNCIAQMTKNAPEIFDSSSDIHVAGMFTVKNGNEENHICGFAAGQRIDS